MFVLCPHCQFLVAVDPVSGLPPARCPRCDGSVLVEAGEPVDNAPAPASEPEVAEVAPEVVASGDEDAPAQTAGQASTAAPEEAPGDAPAEGAGVETPAGVVPTRVAKPRKLAPSFARARVTSGNPATSRDRWPQIVLISALSLTLVLQILVVDRAQLAADAQWRPTIALLCATLRCDLPPWREPAAFRLLERNVAPDPSKPGVLHVTASFRNDAHWPQPWPKLLLTLSDVDGRLAGARLFEPREYLGRAATENGLASGQSASVAMDIVEPAPQIVTFTFDFR
jgi:hypothetical protein